VLEKLVIYTTTSVTMKQMTIEDRVLIELHRAAIDAGRRGIAVPSVDLARAATDGLDRTAVEEATRRLVNARRVTRVRRDLLVLPDAAGLIGVGLADIVDVIAPDPYLITGGRALEQSELTDQHYFGLTVLVPKEMSPVEYRGEKATFFVTDPSNICGATDGRGPRFARPERALVDVLNHPRFGVSLTQAADALIRARAADSDFLVRLFDAVRDYGAGARNHGARAAARRVGYVVERIFGPKDAEPFRALIGPNRAPVPLRPGGRRHTGFVDPVWRVLVNATVEPELVP
jgi:predicted transcriptional regulator of viral defense system